MVYKLVIRLIKKMRIFIEKFSPSLPQLFESESSQSCVQELYGLSLEFILNSCGNSELMVPVVGKKASPFPFYSSYT